MRHENRFTHTIRSKSLNNMKTQQPLACCGALPGMRSGWFEEPIPTNDDYTLPVTKRLKFIYCRKAQQPLACCGALPGMKSGWFEEPIPTNDD